MKIYTVTLLDIKEKSNFENTIQWLIIFSQRCVGFEKTLQEAMDSVEINKGEMHEGCYNHIVIEEFQEGVWSNFSKDVAWYKWEGRWVKIDRPKGFGVYNQLRNGIMFR